MKQCTIIGGGDSIRELREKGLWEQIRDKEVWSINYAFQTMPYLPTREIWHDTDFFKKNITKLQELAEKGVLCYSREHTLYKGIPKINTCKCTRDIHQQDKSIYIGTQGLSGFFALRLATIENYDRVFLLGFDFCSNGNRTHYYQGELQVESIGVGNHKVYANEYGNPVPAVKDWEVFTSPDIKTEIYNVSAISKIPYFPKLTPEQFFEKVNEKEQSL